MVFSDEVQDEPVRVVAAVIIRDGCVLACRRNPDRSAGGLWEFPGGKVEPGESPEDALTREIREELGVIIEVGKLIHRATTPTGTAHIDLSSYEARLTDAPPPGSTDHDVLRWLRPNQLQELEWAQPDLPVVELLRQRPLVAE
ncbi:(deoxy)nucleoside triphosphate pyrophosphohydrolase [Rathayibacter soli]|uniref:(deoxy)nucleoside triphosphate pyrophosphohydrolase n=1 Tax=Rathayibacter soli TaxID=3144168 RepID=UPI0027E3DB4E|nr:(deoxy)nucleoside triphosphate pyrophosphohydrolase [Glaciibacter superstes]